MTSSTLHRLSLGQFPRREEKSKSWPYPPLPDLYDLYGNDDVRSDKKMKLDSSTASESSSLGSRSGYDESMCNARPPCFHHVFEELIFVFTVMMAVSCTTFLQGVILINTATIGRSLHMSPAEITWIAAAIGLGSGSFMLFFGKTADMVGYKSQLLAGMAWLSAWSLGTAYAPNAIAMNVFCGMLGVGTAMISPPAIGAMFATYPEGKRRHLVTGALGTANPIGFVMGSMSSGVLTKHFNWRASFIFLAIFFAIVIVLACWTMPAVPREKGIRRTMKTFDYVGTLLTIFGIGLVTFALSQGPEAGWKTAGVIAPLCLGVACVFGFAVWEHICPKPLLDPSIWKRRDFTLCVLAVMFGYGAFATSQFWISLYMQNVQGLSGLQIATRLLAQAIAGIVWSFIGQYLVSRVHGTLIMGVGGISYLAGTLLLVFIRARTSYWRFLFPSLLITVIGADFQFIVSNLFVNKYMASQAALGAGVLQTVMRISISLGLAISTAAYGKSTVELPPPDPLDPQTTRPYTHALLCAVSFAALGCCFIPFMRVNTKDPRRVSSAVSVEQASLEKGRSAQIEEKQGTEQVAGKNEISRVQETRIQTTPSPLLQQQQQRGSHGTRMSGDELFRKHMSGV